MNKLIDPAEISVAMCTYNGERFLPEQLATIAAQTRLPCELVVCDDRSNDRTLEILETFAQTASFPVRIHQNKQQLGSTQNFDKAIRLCKGEYIALSDQDDRWHPEKMNRLGRMLDQNLEAGVAFSDALLIDDASQPVKGSLWHAFRFGIKTRSMFISNPGLVLMERPVLTGATMVFRRSLLRHFTEIPGSWVHDGWIAWMGVFWSQVLLTSEMLTEYRIHSSQQLGVGKISIPDRVRSIRSVQRNSYATAADQLSDLLKYLENSSPELLSRWIFPMSRTMKFFYARAAAPASLGGRLLFLAEHAASYRSLVGPSWRSMVRDLMMGETEIH